MLSEQALHHNTVGKNSLKVSSGSQIGEFWDFGVFPNILGKEDDVAAVMSLISNHTRIINSEYHGTSAHPAAKFARFWSNRRFVVDVRSPCMWK